MTASHCNKIDQVFVSMNMQKYKTGMSAMSHEPIIRSQQFFLADEYPVRESGLFSAEVCLLIHAGTDQATMGCIRGKS